MTGKSTRTPVRGAAVFVFLVVSLAMVGACRGAPTPGGTERGSGTPKEETRPHTPETTGMLPGMALAAMSDVAPQECGLASGVVNTAFMMGGALGLDSLAVSRTESLLTSGDGPLAALNGGYQLAFLVGSLFALAAAVLGTVLLRATAATTPTSTESAVASRADHDPREAPMQSPD
jgi:hypothetical protein